MDQYYLKRERSLRIESTIIDDFVNGMKQSNDMDVGDIFYLQSCLYECLKLQDFREFSDIVYLIDSWCRPTERADVVFIFEESYSMGEMVFPSEWDYQKSFLAKIVDQMYIDPNNGIRVGGVTYNNEPTVRFYLDTHTTKSDIIDAILNIGTTRRESVYENDTDLVYKGLETAYDSVFLSSRGDRADAPNYYIYTTDYIFPDDDPYTTGLNIRFTGDSYIWALGVKSAVTQSALVQSVGSDGRFYTGSSFQTLNTVDHAKEFWELFRGCPLIDPSAGIYCEFLKDCTCTSI